MPKMAHACASLLVAHLRPGHHAITLPCSFKRANGLTMHTLDGVKLIKVRLSVAFLSCPVHSGPEIAVLRCV